MINMIVLVGRLVRDPEIVEQENGNKVSRVTLAVNRKFKGLDGVYHVDYIDCILWNNNAINVNEYCSKGDLIGVRGRLQVNVLENDGEKHKYTDVIAENITFLSTTKNKEIKEVKLAEGT
ncbi:MAG: single-stranded DNA-binding protein [Bacilli bacterium]|nr:single-stranded DNA-binding protein [Bacilli bacterium]